MYSEAIAEHKQIQNISTVEKADYERQLEGLRERASNAEEELEVI